MESNTVQPFYINRGVRNWHETPIPFHVTDAVKVVASLKGTFVTKTQEADYEVPVSSAVVLPQRLPHGYSGKDVPIEMLVITFPRLSARWRSRLLPSDKPRVILLRAKDMSLIDDLHRRCHEEKFRGDAFSPTALGGLAQALLATLVRAGERSSPSVSDARLQIIRQIIVARFHEPLRIRNLARQAAMSEAHFRERYRAIFGRSPKEEIIQLRVGKAQDLLLTTELKLAEIALRCGFCNEHEFSRSFRKFTGLPPGSWRKHG